MFKDIGLKVIGEVNRKMVNFLDVTPNLSTESFRVYTNPNTNLLNINNKSNHPPTILKNIPKAVNDRLCRLSSSKEEFMAAVALDAAGYNHKLVYEQPTPQPPHKSLRTWSRR